ncbi:hypothetical protein C6503_05215 [Candidatus Poribacteria bacterium]|nr:MAG: hypothetical protein C6503_05215 [Candidatus Poribacteria bacterium]
MSLVIEQEPNEIPSKNYGIRPLPNLETKFVAANTLIGLNELRESDLQSLLLNDAIQQLRDKIETIRAKYFSENDREVKLQYIEEEEERREQLAEALATEHTTWCQQEQNKISEQVKSVPKEGARQQLREKLQKAYKVRETKLTAGVVEAKRIADWNPYNQNDKADFFDPEWMFGIKEGFDITIGNPPYVRADAGKNDLEREKVKKMRQEIKDSKQYKTLYKKWDLFIPFIERSYKLLKSGGFTTLIVSDAYCNAPYALKSQEWFLEKSKIIRLDFCSKVPLFGPVGVRNVIFLFQKTDGNDNKPQRREHYPEFGKVHLLPTDEQQNLTHRAFFPEDSDRSQLATSTVTLDNICYITTGMEVQADEKRAQGAFRSEDLLSDVQDDIHPKPFVEGKHLDRWIPATHKWLEWGTDRAPALFRNVQFREMYEVDKKILAQRSPGSDPKVCYDNQNLIFTPASVGFILWHNLKGVKNRSIKLRARYRDEKLKPNLPQREKLEKISSQFSLKFLLGVMNSTVVRDFLRVNRRSNIHIYPDDWKQLPIPDVSPKQQAPIVELVDKILAAKRKGLQKKVSRLEKKLNKKVSALYGIDD